MDLRNCFIPYGAYWSSPFCRWQGSFSQVNSIELAAGAARKFLAAREISPEVFDGLVLGFTVNQKASFYGAPWLAGMIGAGGISGPNVSQACATSARSLSTAALEVEAGAKACVLTVNTDRCSNGPHVYYPNPSGPGGMGEAESPVWDNFNKDPNTGFAMLQTAENVAKKAGITKEEQDEVTLLRNRQYQDALASDRAFQKLYMLPVDVPKGRKKFETVEADEGVFPTSAEGLARLRPVMEGGTVTFGCQTFPADGNAGIVVCNEEKAKAMSRRPDMPVRILSFGDARVEKAHMPMAVPVAAKQALQRAGIAVKDCKAVKTHNPFAVNDIWFSREMGIGTEKVNNYGSPLVYGHPQGPTGARVIIELIEELAKLGGGPGGCPGGGGGHPPGGGGSPGAPPPRAPPRGGPGGGPAPFSIPGVPEDRLDHLIESLPPEGEGEPPRQREKGRHGRTLAALPEGRPVPGVEEEAGVGEGGGRLPWRQGRDPDGDGDGAGPSPRGQEVDAAHRHRVPRPLQPGLRRVHAELGRVRGHGDGPGPGEGLERRRIGPEAQHGQGARHPGDLPRGVQREEIVPDQGEPLRHQRRREGGPARPLGPHEEDRPAVVEDRRPAQDRPPPPAAQARQDDVGDEVEERLRGDAGRGDPREEPLFGPGPEVGEPGEADPEDVPLPERFHRGRPVPLEDRGAPVRPGVRGGAAIVQAHAQVRGSPRQFPVQVRQAGGALDDPVEEADGFHARPSPPIVPRGPGRRMERGRLPGPPSGIHGDRVTPGRREEGRDPMEELAAENAALRRQLDRQKRLVDAAYALHSTLDLDELLTLILRVAAEGVGADRGTVFLLTPEGTELWSRVLSGAGHLEIRLPVGQGIAGSVAASGETVRITDAYEDPRFDRSWDAKSGYRTRQILCAPIRGRDGRTVGVFQLLNKQAGGEFTVEDGEYLAAISVDAALAVENARLHRSALEKERYDREVALVQNVQRHLQPERRAVRAGSLTVAGMNELCEDASGDYYDIIADLPGDRIAVAVGDVSGHGLQAALVMFEARAYLRAFLRTTDGLTRAMDLLNDCLVPDMQSSQFISLFSAVLDADTGTMDWCNAGHNAPLLYRASTGEVRELNATGRIVGILPDSAYRAGAELALEPGDVLLLYTDGVTEARNGSKELFEEERLVASLKRAGSAAADAEGVRDAIRGDLAAFTGETPSEDDVTMLAVMRTR